MSGKRAKELRRQQRDLLGKENGQPQPAPVQPDDKTVISRILINIHSDGNVSVTGFPDDYRAASGYILMAHQAVTLHFLELASNGNLTKEFRKERGRILTPERSGNIIIPGR